MTETGKTEGQLQYNNSIKIDFEKCYIVAEKARDKNRDPKKEVEIIPAEDVAGRVEGLVGPVGIALYVREIMPQFKDREGLVVQIVNEILDGKWPAKTLVNSTDEKEIKIEQAVRTGLALYTEGVVSAPIEGVVKLKLKKNADGSEYLSVYFSGPIRGAGGTGQAFTLLLADYCRLKMGVGNYRPTDGEVDRYVEEANLYAIKTRSGQYVPTEEEIRHIIRNCAVCIDGEPTEEYEVNVNKNVQNVESNRVRGGAVLVMSEGVCLKAAKIINIAKKLPGIDWNWVEKLIKATKTTATKFEIKPNDKYMKDIVAGRPIFSYPSTPGGFTLRYGRTRLTGIAAKAIHPATMIVLGKFPAIGTQVKVERPGKGCIVTPCETIDGPFVRLKNGNVLRVQTLEKAEEIENEVEKIIFLGDILINYGDFLKANHPLIPGAWCSEWYAEELKAKGVNKTKEECEQITFDEATALSREKGVALAPRFTLYWSDFKPIEIKQIAHYITTGKLNYLPGDEQNLTLTLPLQKPEKELLENLGVEHVVDNGEIKITSEMVPALLFPLGMHAALQLEKFNERYSEEKPILEILHEICGVEIINRPGNYIGSSMGRPEKSKERKMQPPVHGLFPIGHYGGKLRSIGKAVQELKKKGERVIQTEIAIRMCPSCKIKTPLPKCACSRETILARQCTDCGSLCVSEFCPKCKKKAKQNEKQPIDLITMYENAVKATQMTDAKGVIGLISERKPFEIIEKALLRAKHNVYVFRDGTTRVDATEIPITHFIPSEIETSIEKLHELGYTHDANGAPLTDVNQVVELRAQDIIINKISAEYLMRVTKFVDDLLVYVYEMPAFYDAKTINDLIGQLTICIAPHISAGITTRIIGFTTTRGLLAHPYVHCACRRNSDGDELAFMLLLDSLINFSREFLPATRGGKMDAPLVLSSQLTPTEVDDEVHAMDVCDHYPLEFYQATLRNAMPKEVKLDTVSSRLGKPEQFENLHYTHACKLQGPVETSYVTLETMKEKVAVELEMMQRIRAVKASGAAERIIQSHFFPDLYGNLRSFGRQIFRCVDCNAKFRRIPLRGKCSQCGGKLILTINRGGIEKYLELSKAMAEKYELPLYLKQRLLLIERDITSLFEDEKSKQFSLAAYV
ncbi:MAG: DNA polymerase II large subunit [Candidatus Micrarchaeota archaeon]